MKNRSSNINHLKINTDVDNTYRNRNSKSSVMPDINDGKKIKNEIDNLYNRKNDYLTPKNKIKNENMNLGSNNPLIGQNTMTPQPTTNFNIFKSNKNNLVSSNNKKILSKTNNSNSLWNHNEVSSVKNIVNINFSSNNQKSNTTNKSGLSIPIENPIEISKLLSTNHIPISLENINLIFPQFESSRCSMKSTPYIKAYAANTHQGIVRTYNEDRVAIILNINRPSTFRGDHWPQCSIFAIYDGHGGNGCSDYLRDNLHEFVVRDPHFPQNPKEAILKGFENAEKDYLNNYAMNKDFQILDRSGSCALFCMVLDNICYIANVGDSRAVLSLNNGKSSRVLTKDHKPNDKDEEQRITSNGGKIYQTQTLLKNFSMSTLTKTKTTFNLNPNQPLLGPCRVFPGRLSVSRAFGNVEAKLPRFGGNPNVVVSTPDIESFEINSENDFLILGCDGIYDQLSNEDIIKCVILSQQDNIKKKTLHHQVGLSVDFILKSSMCRKTLDNVTCVVLAFENYEKQFNSSSFLNKNTNSDSKNITSSDLRGNISLENGLIKNNKENIDSKAPDISELRNTGLNSFRYTMKKTQLRLFKKPLGFSNDLESPVNKIKSERQDIPSSPFCLHAPIPSESKAKELSNKIQSTSIHLYPELINKEFHMKAESSRTSVQLASEPNFKGKSTLQKFLGLKKIIPTKKYNSFKEISLHSQSSGVN